jgi:hypothetical protein
LLLLLLLLLLRVSVIVSHGFHLLSRPDLCL